MKKSTLILAIGLGISSLMVTGCGNSDSETKACCKKDTTEYYCPMKCEGDKIYAEKGSCPTCGMDLIKAE